MKELSEQNRETIKGLRDLANFLESRPTLGIPGYLTVNMFADTEEQFRVAARLFGNCEKGTTENWFFLRKTFGKHIKLEVNRSRDKVCARVTTGTRLVPAKPEKTVVLPAEPERVEEIFEWVCPDSIFREGAEAS